jgi:hypothetical protein
MNLHKIKEILLDIISFDSAQAKVFNFITMFIIAGVLPTDKLKYLPIRSVYENVFHLKLYSSGMTRAMSRLFHGDIAGAWQFNKLVFVVVLTMLVLIIINLIICIKDYKKNGKIYPKLGI